MKYKNNIFWKYIKIAAENTLKKLKETMLKKSINKIKRAV